MCTGWDRINGNGNLVLTFLYIVSLILLFLILLSVLYEYLISNQKLKINVHDIVVKEIPFSSVVCTLKMNAIDILLYAISQHRHCHITTRFQALSINVLFESVRWGIWPYISNIR